MKSPQKPPSEAPDGSNADEVPTSGLVRHAQLDRAKFCELYKRVAGALYAWAVLRMTPALRRALEPEDVVQEVWCRALDKLSTYDPSKSAFRTWIFAIANHVILQGYRRLKNHAQPRGMADPSVSGALGISAIEDDGTTISRAVSRDERVRACIDAILSLKEEDQRVFLHCGLEGLSAPVAAPLLSSTPDATLKRWQRLRQRLRDDPAFANLIDNP